MIQDYRIKKCKRNFVQLLILFKQGDEMAKIEIKSESCMLELLLLIPDEIANLDIWISPRVQVNDIVKYLLLQLINVRCISSLVFYAMYFWVELSMILISCILVFAIGSEGTADINYCFN